MDSKILQLIQEVRRLRNQPINGALLDEAYQEYKEIQTERANARRIICATHGWEYHENDDTNLVSKSVEAICKKFEEKQKATGRLAR